MLHAVTQLCFTFWTSTTLLFTFVGKHKSTICAVFFVLHAENTVQTQRKQIINNPTNKNIKKDKIEKIA